MRFINCIENAFGGGYKMLFRQAGIHGLLVQGRRKKPAVASNGCIEEPSGLDIEHHPCQRGGTSVSLQRLQVLELPEKVGDGRDCALPGLHLPLRCVTQGIQAVQANQGLYGVEIGGLGPAIPERSFVAAVRDENDELQAIEKIYRTLKKELDP